jgi:hypothetical protein
MLQRSHGWLAAPAPSPNPGRTATPTDGAQPNDITAGQAADHENLARQPIGLTSRRAPNTRSAADPDAAP